MIYGIGTDIVQVNRLQTSLEKHGERFAQRILSDNEYQEFLQKNDAAHFLAKRFAAKEAAAKAFGTGFRQGLSLKHIEVKNTEHGRPDLVFRERAQELVAEFNISHTYISIADEREYAIAYVIMTTKGLQ